MTRLGITAALAATTMLAGAAGAQTVIDFDTVPGGGSLPSGTTVSNQYASLGVTFEGFEDGTPFNVVVTNFFSSSNILINSSDDGFTSRHDVVRISFASGASNISLRLDTLGNEPITFNLYDADGLLLEAQSVATDGVVSFAASGVRRIDGLQPNDFWGWGLDDLTFLLAALDDLTADEIAALVGAVGGTGRLLVVGADGVVRDAGAVSLATRDGHLTLTRVADGSATGEVTASAQNLPGFAGGLYTWAEVTGFRSDDYAGGLGTLGGAGLQIGADLEVGAGMVAGLSLGFSEVSAEAGGFRTEGSYAYLQPYFAYRSGAWAGTASLILGQGSFDQTSAGGDGAADVTLAALTFEGGYDIALAPGYTLTPTLGLVHGREQVDGTSGTLAGLSQDVTFSQGSLGARIAVSGADGRLFAGLHADYLTQDAGSILAADLLAEDGWSGRLEIGAETALGNGLGLSTSIELGGIGSGLETVSGGLRVALSF